MAFDDPGEDAPEEGPDFICVALAALQQVTVKFAHDVKALNYGSTFIRCLHYIAFDMPTTMPTLKTISNLFVIESSFARYKRQIAEEWTSALAETAESTREVISMILEHYPDVVAQLTVLSERSRR